MVGRVPFPASANVNDFSDVTSCGKARMGRRKHPLTIATKFTKSAGVRGFAR